MMDRRTFLSLAALLGVAPQAFALAKPAAAAAAPVEAPAQARRAFLVGVSVASDRTTPAWLMQGRTCVANIPIFVANVLIQRDGIVLGMPAVNPDSLRLMSDWPALAAVGLAYPTGGGLRSLDDLRSSRIETLYLTSTPSESASADV
jgi:hypothetical protein